MAYSPPFGLPFPTTHTEEIEYIMNALKQIVEEKIGAGLVPHEAWEQTIRHEVATYALRPSLYFARKRDNS